MTYLKKRSMPPVCTSRPEAAQIADLKTRLQQQYSVDPVDIQVVKSPLRICPLGAHIDHQLGHVSGMALNQAVLLAFAPVSEPTITIESINFSPPLSFDMNDIPPASPGDWGNYIRGAVRALQQDHTLKQGMVGVIGGEMPVGGLSSSAAVTCAYLLALETIHGLQISAEDNIALARYTENSYLGLNNGILDQSVILFSQVNQLTYIDCETFEITQLASPLSPQDYDILIVYCGRGRILSGTDYNNRVAECQEAAQQLQTYAQQEAPPDVRLRHVDPAIFAAEGHRLPEVFRRRATHYFGEFQRVSDGLQAWQAGNLHKLGELINQSGESSIKYYESGSPQLITLYEILSQTPGVYGTRFSGAGFGGCCIALIDPQARESIAQAIHQQYPSAHPEEAELYSIHFCQSAGHVQLL